MLWNINTSWIRGFVDPILWDLMCRERDLLNTLQLICRLTAMCFFKELFFHIFLECQRFFCWFWPIFLLLVVDLRYLFHCFSHFHSFIHQVEYVEAVWPYNLRKHFGGRATTHYPNIIWFLGNKGFFFFFFPF